MPKYNLEFDSKTGIVNFYIDGNKLDVTSVSIGKYKHHCYCCNIECTCPDETVYVCFGIDKDGTNHTENLSFEITDGNISKITISDNFSKEIVKAHSMARAAANLSKLFSKEK